MRVTVSHNKGRHAAALLVHEYSDQLLAGAASGPVEITDIQKQWDNYTMWFSLVGRMGVFSAPVRGFVDVTEKDVTVDIELPGMLKHFVPEDKARAQVEARIKGLLNS